jgi:4-amino-4-deoxy-L-arabinose transferase-like glycosyltransferase
MPIPPRTLRWQPLALLLAVGALFLLPGLDRMVMSRQQEFRIALTARTMAEGGNWLLPEYMGELRVRKPPLMNWLVASAFKLAGTTRSAAVARLPSALSGLALMALLYLAAARFLGRRRAFVAALVAGTSFIFLRQGRMAETDVLLTFFTAASALAGFTALSRPRAARWWLAAGLCAGLGFMTKGPAALILPLAALGAYTAARADARRDWRSWSLAGAIAIFAVVAVPWYAYILVGGGQEAVRQQLQDEIARAAAESYHPGPWYYYFYTTLQGLAPWSLILPWALAWGWRHRRRRLPLFALLWFCTTFLVLSVLHSKQVHYALLLVPPASLLTGDFLAAGWATTGRRGRTARVLLLALLACGATAGLALMILPWFPGDVRLPPLPLVLLGAATGLTGLWGLVERAHARRALAAWITALWFACGAGAWIIQPLLKESRVIPETIEQARPLIATAPQLFLAGAHHPVMVFYCGRPARYFGEASAAWRAAQPGDLLVVARRGEYALPVKPLVRNEVQGLYCEVVRKPPR